MFNIGDRVEVKNVARRLRGSPVERGKVLFLTRKDPCKPMVGILFDDPNCGIQRFEPDRVRPLEAVEVLAELGERP